MVKKNTELRSSHSRRGGARRNQGRISELDFFEKLNAAARCEELSFAQRYEVSKLQYYGEYDKIKIDETTKKQREIRENFAAETRENPSLIRINIKKYDLAIKKTIQEIEKYGTRIINGKPVRGYRIKSGRGAPPSNDPLAQRLDRKKITELVAVELSAYLGRKISARNVQSAWEYIRKFNLDNWPTDTNRSLNAYTETSVFE